MAEYDGSEATVILGGQRIEQVMSIETPDVSYDREYDDTLADDENVLLQDKDADLEAEFVVAPTSGSIPFLETQLEEGNQNTMTIRLPADHAQDNEKLLGVVLTEKSDDTFDGEDSNNRTYSYIADDTA